MRQFDDINAGGKNKRQEDTNTDGDHGEDNFDDEYSANTEHGDREARLRQRLHCNHECMNRRRDVQNNDDAFGKIKFNIPPFDGKYDPDAYITLIKSLHVMNFLRIHVLGLLLVSLLILLLFGG